MGEVGRAPCSLLALANAFSDFSSWSSTTRTATVTSYQEAHCGFLDAGSASHVFGAEQSRLDMLIILYVLILETAITTRHVRPSGAQSHCATAAHYLPTRCCVLHRRRHSRRSLTDSRISPRTIENSFPSTKRRPRCIQNVCSKSFGKDVARRRFTRIHGR